MAEKRPALGRGLSRADSRRAAPPPAAGRARARRRHRSAAAEPVPAAHARWTTRGSRSWRARSSPTASSSRSSSARPTTATRSSPASAAGAPSQRAGLLKVPVVVRDIPEDRLLAVALIENIQREDLNPIEEAQAYRRLADEFQLTQEQIADAVGKDRSSVANYLRLLKLPARSPRQRRRPARCRWGTRARCSALPDEAAQLRVARDVVARSLSVRETEALVKKAASRRRRSRRAARRTSTRAPPKSSCASRSAPACASSARARADASRSTSRRRRAAAASTKQLTERQMTSAVTRADQ